MEISRQPHAPAALHPGGNHCGHSLKGFVGPTGGLDALGTKEKIFPVWNRISDRPVCTPVA